MPWADIAEGLRAYVPEGPGYKIMPPIQSEGDGQWWIVLDTPNSAKWAIGTYATAGEATDAYERKGIELSQIMLRALSRLTEDSARPAPTQGVKPVDKEAGEFDEGYTCGFNADCDPPMNTRPLSPYVLGLIRGIVARYRAKAAQTK